jgi:hypothetical protein
VGTSNRIFRVGAGGAVKLLAAGASLDHPNGITWDARHGRLLVGSFDPFRGSVYAMRPGDPRTTTLITTKGRVDGVEPLPDGRIAYTSWVDSSVHAFDGTTDERIIRFVPQPADIGVDTRRNRIAVPVDGRDRVEVWQLPTAPQRVAVRR